MPRRAKRLTPDEVSRRRYERFKAGLDQKATEKAEYLDKRYQHTIDYRLKEDLHTPLPPQFKTPIQYLRQLIALQRVVEIREHSKHGIWSWTGTAQFREAPAPSSSAHAEGSEGGLVPLSTYGLRTNSPSPRRKNDTHIGQLFDLKTKRRANPIQVMKEFYEGNHRLSVMGTKETKILNEQVPTMRRILLDAYKGKPEEHLFQMLCNAFYVSGTYERPMIELHSIPNPNGKRQRGERKPQIRYMTKNLWKIYDYLVKKTGEALEKQQR